MLDTFKARIKAKYPAIKFTQKRIDTIAEKLNKKHPNITDEVEHDTHIDNLYDEADLVEIAKLDEVFDNASKPKPAQPEPAKPTEPAPADKPKSEIEKLTEIVTGLATAVKTLTTEREAQVKTQTLKQKFEAKKVPEKFWARMQHPEKPEDFDTFVDEVSKDYQELIPDNTFVPGRGERAPSKANDKQLNTLVDDLMGVNHEENKN